jgi:predicted phage baseplate assembly protein
VASLYGRAPLERVFVARTDDTGTTTVQFGDGITGARLPSGQDNVRASYRKGIGRDGNVKAGQLSLLLSRPLGVRGVINPQAAAAGDGPESLRDARVNAPLAVLTLNRTVSLQDYEDFARAFAGIAKALATWTWDGRNRRVFLTVAGPDGAAVPADGALAASLASALRQAGDPMVDVRVATYRSAHFRIAGSVTLDADFLPSTVLPALDQALRDAFGFAARGFGQPVTLSELLAVMHGVPGVGALDLDALHRTGEPAVLHSRLLAELPTVMTGGVAAAAELLTLDPEPPALGVMA